MIKLLIKFDEWIIKYENFVTLICFIVFIVGFICLIVK